MNKCPLCGKELQDGEVCGCASNASASPLPTPIVTSPADSAPAAPIIPTAPVMTAPGAPVEPAAPVMAAPGAPVEPTGPVLTAPGAPVEPTGPVLTAPGAPVEPTGPVLTAPGAPVEPAAPVMAAPGAPVEPAAPIMAAPGAPVEPATPVMAAPGAPVEPATPVMAAPGAPVEPAAPIMAAPGGAPVEPAAPIMAAPGGAPAMSAPAPKQPMSKKTKNIIIGSCCGAAALVIAIIVAVVLMLLPTTIDVAKYVKVSYEGFSGDAYADIRLDTKKIIRDYKLNDKEAAALRAGCLSVFPDEYRDDYANGDEILLDVTISETYKGKRLRLKPKQDVVTIKVEGLKELESVDIFSNIEIKFTGYNGNSNYEIINTGALPYFDDLYFSVEPYSDFSNGDTISVSVDMYSDAQEEYSITPSEKYKSYTVSGLRTLLENPADLGSDVVASVDKQCRYEIENDLMDYSYDYTRAAYDEASFGVDVISYTADLVAARVYNSDYVYEGGSNNDLFFIYKITSVDDSAKGGSTFYYAVGYHNAESADGTTYTVDLSRKVYSYDDCYAPTLEELADKLDGSHAGITAGSAIYEVSDSSAASSESTADSTSSDSASSDSTSSDSASSDSASSDSASSDSASSDSASSDSASSESESQAA